MGRLIYIAAPWAEREKLPAIAAQFEAAGHEITWKWWETDDIPEGGDREAELREQAENDFWGVFKCETLILINSAKSEGKAVEQGIALASGIPIIAVGERGLMSLNVFHYMDDYTWKPTVEEALEELNHACESD